MIMIDLILKAIVGMLFVIVISVLSKTKLYYFAGILPLFPTFSLMSHYIIGTSNTTAQFKDVLLLSMWSVIPFFLYLLTVYYLYNKTSIYYSLAGGLVSWIIACAILILVWNH